MIALRFSSGIFILSLILACSGCEQKRKVRNYSVPRTSPPRTTLNVEEFQSQLDHFLVAIVLDGEKAWFFKLVGKAPSIERQKDAFAEFLATVEPTGQGKPSWVLPAGWEERKSQKAMRLITIVVPDESGDLEIAVSTLPYNGDWDYFLQLNVERWMRQLSRPALESDVIQKLVQEFPIKNGTASVIQLAGVFQDAAPRRNPHAGMVSTETPKSNKDAPQKPVASTKELTYLVPEGWSPGRMNSMRKAAFLLPGGTEKDEMVVTKFPIGRTEMDKIAPNVRRWADQVLLQISEEKAEELAEAIEIGGLEGTLVELESPENAPTPLAIHAAMVVREGNVWFFKMFGKAEVVKEQQAAFRGFLDSVKFQ